MRLGRGTLANVDLISKVSVMPGGTHVAVLEHRAQTAGEPPPVAHPARAFSPPLTRRPHADLPAGTIHPIVATAR